MQVVVPARPGAAPLRHQARVGVQNGLVPLVGNRAENLRLGGARVGEQSQRDVGVDRDHDLVEALARVVERDHHAAPARRWMRRTGVRRWTRSRNGAISAST